MSHPIDELMSELDGLRAANRCLRADLSLAEQDRDAYRDTLNTVREKSSDVVLFRQRVCAYLRQTGFLGVADDISRWT